MTDRSILAYYAAHSPITDPGPYAALFDSLPQDVPSLTGVITGLIMHPAATPLYGEPPVPLDAAWGIRTVADTLQRLLAFDDAPLTIARPPGKRLRANCRNFAVLLVAMLRHRGVPARKRVGFASYLPAPHLGIHEIAEYWSEEEARWVLVDPDCDEVVRRAQRAYFASVGQPARAEVDSFDLRSGEAFLVGGAAWHSCRAGAADPDMFWVSTGTGMGGIRIALVQDLDSLNKAELLSNDEWHELLAKPEEQLAPAERSWLEQAAALTVGVDERFDELRAFYKSAPYGQAVRLRLGILGLLS